MTHFRLIDMLSEIPRPHNMDAVHAGLSNWRAAVAERPTDTPSQQRLADVAEAIERDPGSKALLEAIFGNSLFLSQCVNRDPEFFCNLVCDGANDSAATILQDIAEKGKDSLNNKQLMQAVRVAKRRMALAIAVADLGNVWDLEKITRKLSETADATLSTAAAHLIREAARMGAFELADREHPEYGSGLIVIGMGKLGAFELNYSSDIDLIIFYDTDRISTANPDKLQNQMVRLARSLVRFMDERTADGYVFRTDLRLRPDPGATPLAVSVNAAETYYESLGQNWERAAMIKARPVAGDLEAGVAFLKHLTPFIWRKSLDFAAIQDIHSIKRQINAHREGATAGAEGHNIKLGAGGIREIEFFAQTHQLIHGGRDPSLRVRGTRAALDALAATGRISSADAQALGESYDGLRTIEHRLQMVGDKQTHTLPAGEALDTAARLHGLDGGAALIALVEDLARPVAERFDALLDEDRISVPKSAPHVVADTGAAPDIPVELVERMSQWTGGRYPALRSTATAPATWGAAKDVPSAMP